MVPNPLLPSIPDLLLILAIAVVVIVVVGIGLAVWLSKRAARSRGQQPPGDADR